MSDQEAKDILGLKIATTAEMTIEEIDLSQIEGLQSFAEAGAEKKYMLIPHAKNPWIWYVQCGDNDDKHPGKVFRVYLGAAMKKALELLDVTAEELQNRKR